MENEFDATEEQLEEARTSEEIFEFLLNGSKTMIEEIQVYPGERFIKAKMPFTIRALSQDEFEEIGKKSKQTKFIRGQKQTDFNEQKFSELCIITATIKPNFRDAKFIQSLGVTLPADAMKKTLLPGEMATLAARISEISGFDTDLDSKVDEIKNV